MWLHGMNTGWWGDLVTWINGMEVHNYVEMDRRINCMSGNQDVAMS